MKGFQRSPKRPQQQSVASHKGEAHSGSSGVCLTLCPGAPIPICWGFFPFCVVFKRPGVAVAGFVGKESQSSIPGRAHGSGAGKGKIPNLNVLYRDSPKGIQRRKQYGKILIQGNIFLCKCLVGNGAGEAEPFFLVFIFFTFSYFLFLFLMILFSSLHSTPVVIVFLPSSFQNIFPFCFVLFWF